MNDTTKQLIIELSEFRDKIGLNLKKDESNRINIIDEQSSQSYSISQAELEAMKEIMDKKPELQELAPGLYVSCFFMTNLFKNEWA